MSAPDYGTALIGKSDLAAYDAAPVIGDLDAYDTATGVTYIPAGWYLTDVVRGELVTTKTGKRAYRLTLDVVEGDHVGHRLWKYELLDTKVAMNRAKAVLAPLGLTSHSELQQVFPRAGQSVRLRTLVSLRSLDDGTIRNDVERFIIDKVDAAPPNPHAIDMTAYASTKGGQA